MLWGIRVLVPEKLQLRVREMLHEGHLDIVQMKALARSYLWWPGLDHELEQLAKAYTQCQKEQSSPAVLLLYPWSWPTRPWARVHLDFAGRFQGRMFLVAVDAHSKWPEVVEMSTTQTVAVLRKMFTANELPEQLVSDNGPQFVSGKFASFCQFKGIKHIRVSPYHSSSNGLAERIIHTFKVASANPRKMVCRSCTVTLVFSSCTVPLLREVLPFHQLSCSWDVLSVPDWTCCTPIHASQKQHNMTTIAKRAFSRLVSLFLFAISTEVLVGACHHCERVGTCLFHGSGFIWITMETTSGPHPCPCGDFRTGSRASWRGRGRVSQLCQQHKC